MKSKKKWVILEHTDHPNDPKGIHFDLLLEDRCSCRTWRLSEIPVLDGEPLKVVPLPSHKLEWLERKIGKVSRGRGMAKRILGGFFYGALPKADSPLHIDLYSSELIGRLEIDSDICKLCSISLFETEKVKNT